MEPAKFLIEFIFILDLSKMGSQIGDTGFWLLVQASFLTCLTFVVDVASGRRDNKQ